MEKGIIQVDPRHTARRIKVATQGNAIRALVELITNSNDSYIDMEESGLAPAPVIDVIYRKEGYSGFFAVRDRAQGMSFEDVKKNFTRYGASSGKFKSGKRGYFGQGAKDALAGMQKGEVCSIKDGQFTSCKLYIENGNPMYEMSDPIPATAAHRNKYGIAQNGTYASFLVDPTKQGRVPQFGTVQAELSKNYQLRKIMSNPQRSIWLIEVESGDKRRLRYESPTGKQIHNEKLAIEYPGYGSFPLEINIKRSEDELTQSGDDREGGLLILDDKDAVLGISLFRFDNEPLAARFFGEVKIDSFRKLLDKEEAVLKEDRDGLEIHHPFYLALACEVEKRLDVAVNAEKLRKQKQAQTEIDAEEGLRYKKAISLLNEIAEKEAQVVINLGDKPGDQPEDPPNGFCLYPPAAEVTVGKRYSFELRLKRDRVRKNSMIKITCSNPKIQVITSDLTVTPEDGMGLVRKRITIQGLEPGVEGTLRATTADLASESRIHVIPEKELLLEEGMAFQPESITLRPNQPRKVFLLVYVKMLPNGSNIRISSDNSNIHISKQSISVSEADAVRHIAKYELDIWGEGTGQRAVITAECGEFMALLDAQLKSKEDEPDQRNKGMFGEPDFDSDPEPSLRTRYSAQTGKVIIYFNFPSIQLYLGEDCRFRKTLPAQVLIADLVAECCFLEIAKRKVEGRAAMLNPEASKDLIQRDAAELSKKYGKKLHEALVDQSLLKEVKVISNGKKTALSPAH